MSYFNPGFRVQFLEGITSALYSKDSAALNEKKVNVLKDALAVKGHSAGFFEIYYDGIHHPVTLNISTAYINKITKFDLPTECEPALDKALFDIAELDDEKHNVQGLLRSVLNASESYADIAILTPARLQKKCPDFFSKTRDTCTLTSSEIKAFEIKHENMLSGLKNKVLRDLLLRKK